MAPNLYESFERRCFMSPCPTICNKLLFRDCSRLWLTNLPVEFSADREGKQVFCRATHRLDQLSSPLQLLDQRAFDCCLQLRSETFTRTGILTPSARDAACGDALLSFVALRVTFTASSLWKPKNCQKRVIFFFFPPTHFWPIRLSIHVQCSVKPDRNLHWRLHFLPVDLL